MKPWSLSAAGAIVTLTLFMPLTLKQGEGGVPVSELLIQEEPLTVLFLGDIMLDRSVARHRRAAGDDALFQGVQPIFAQHDIVVGNLEGTITTNPSVSEVDNTILRFTFEPVVAEILNRAGITAVSLANNHALDFGEFGYDDTRYYLQEANVAAFGSPFNEHIALAITEKEQELCLVGYHELFRRDPSKVVAKILEIEPACDHTVVVAHWGMEYERDPSTSQQELARLFVDSGADLIIGAHPHVVQTFETYNNVAIFYSLGNFIFDQRWRPEVRRGFMLSVEFKGPQTTFTIIPVNTYLEATLADAEVSTDVLTDLGVDSATFVLKK